jgi:hypothetical protein
MLSQKPAETNYVDGTMGVSKLPESSGPLSISLSDGAMEPKCNYR